MWPQTRGCQLPPPLPQGSGCTLAFRESEINWVECPGEAPGAALLDFSVCHFPKANAAPKSVWGPLTQFLERLEDLALEARSHHSAESIQGNQVEVNGRQARPTSQPPTPLCCRQEALEPAVI